MSMQSESNRKNKEKLLTKNVSPLLFFTYVISVAAFAVAVRMRIVYT